LMSPMQINEQNILGRRSGIERRQIVYTIHIPERRSGKDRRVCPDRRKNTKAPSIDGREIEKRTQSLPRPTKNPKTIS